MHDQMNRDINGWSVTLRPQRDTALPWRVVAIDGEGNGTFANGFSREDALTQLSNKLGFDPQTILSAFGLWG